MFRFFRRIRKALLEKNNVRSYLGYAVGEIALVVIGILIAIQVSNWNQDRIEDELLWGYLQNIKANIASDINQARELAYVYDEIERVTPRVIGIIDSERVSGTEASIVLSHFASLTNIGIFRSNRSGFEALKNTGAIADIQGSHMEELLNLYYAEADIIEEELRRARDIRDDALKAYNRSELGVSFSDFLRLTADPSGFDDFHDTFLKMFHSRAFQSVLGGGFYNRFDEYNDTINRIGAIIIATLDEGRLYTSDEDMTRVRMLELDTSGEAIANIVVNGSYPASLYFITETNLGNDGISARATSEYLSVDFEANLEWGVAILVVGAVAFEDVRHGRDYSQFKSVEFEVRGGSEGQEVFFSIKDSLDADDGSETRVSVRLSEDWQRYTFDTDAFTTADLASLNAVAIFAVLSGEPTTLDIRNIRYVRGDQ